MFLARIVASGLSCQLVTTSHFFSTFSLFRSLEYKSLEFNNWQFMSLSYLILWVILGDLMRLGGI